MKLLPLLYTLLIALLILPLTHAAPSNENVSTCRDLNNSHNYWLTSDITVENGTCFPMTFTGAALDCQNHVIRSNTSQGSAIFLTVQGLKVSNCWIDNFSTGSAINVTNSNNVKIENVSINDALIGVKLENVNNANITNLDYSSGFPNSIGLLLVHSNVTASDLHINAFGPIGYSIISQNLGVLTVEDSVLSSDKGSYFDSSSFLLRHVDVNSATGSGVYADLNSVGSIFTSNVFAQESAISSKNSTINLIAVTLSGSNAIDQIDGFTSTLSTQLTGNIILTHQPASLNRGEIILEDSSFDSAKVNLVTNGENLSIVRAVQSIYVNVSSASLPLIGAQVNLTTNLDRKTSLTNINGIASISPTLLLWNLTGFFNYSTALITAQNDTRNASALVILNAPFGAAQIIQLQLSKIISNCRSITTSGVYVLNQSLVTDATGGVANPKTCIDIQAANVLLNGNGFNITSTHGLFQNQLGVKINASNVTVQNLVIYNYSNGVNTTAVKLQADGFGAVFLENVTFDNVTFLNVANALTTKGKLVNSLFSNILLNSTTQAGNIRFNITGGSNGGGVNINFTNITIYDSLSADTILVDFNVSLVNSSIINVMTTGNAKGLIDLVNPENVLVSNVTSNSIVRTFGIQSNSTSVKLSNINLNLTSQTINPIIAISFIGQQYQLPVILSDSSILVSKGTAISTIVNLDVVHSNILNGNLTIASINSVNVNLLDTSINTLTQITALQGLNQVNILQSIIVNVLNGANGVDSAFGEVNNLAAIQNFTTNATGSAYLNITTFRIAPPLVVTHLENLTVNASKTGFNANQLSTTLNTSVNYTQIINLALSPIPAAVPQGGAGGGGGGGGGGSGGAVSHPVVQNVTPANVTNNTQVTPVVEPNETINVPVVVANTTNQTVIQPQSSTGLFLGIGGDVLLGGAALVILIGAAVWYTKLRRPKFGL